MIKRLDLSWFEQIYALMEEAFPYSERRTKEEQRKLFDLEPYEVYGWIEKGKLCAFLCAWDLGTFRFGEHLATDIHLRNQGIGKKLFQAYEALSTRPIVFEVELPDTEIAKRRISFYERLGYHYYGDIEYYQGPFHNEEIQLPLRLMMSDPFMKQEEIDLIIDAIYEQVYNRKRWF